MDCLVLSQGYEPLERCSWEDAVSKWLNEKAEVLEWSSTLVWSGLTEVAGQMYEEIFKPSVIRLLSHFQKKKSVRFSRENVYLRDKGSCQYCGMKVTKGESTLDHIIPRTNGGGTTWENVVICCFDCNQCKSARPQVSCGKRKCGKCKGQRRPMKLRSEPMKPDSLPPKAKAEFLLRGGRVPRSWKAYISYLYWNVELELDD